MHLLWYVSIYDTIIEYFFGILFQDIAFDERVQEIAMAVYYILILALAGTGYLFTEKRKYPGAAAIYLVAAFCSLLFITSFRYAIGFDYFSYRDIYYRSAQLSFRDILQMYWYEPLFHLISRVFSMNGIPYQVFLTCINCFLLSAAMWFISHYSKIPWMGVYFYITLQFLAYDMNLLRQSMALCFFMFAYPYLKGRKIVPYTLLILAGGLIHNSLWFVYPLYILLPVKYTKKIAAAVTGAAVCGYIFFDPLFGGVQQFLPLKYASYQGSYYWNASGLAYVVPSFLYLVLMYLNRRHVSDVAIRCIYLNSAFYNFLISLFLTKHFILERFAVYPFVISLAAIPDILADHKEKAAEEGAFQPVRLEFLLFGALTFLFAAERGFHHVYPYISLLDKSSSVPVP